MRRSILAVGALAAILACGTQVEGAPITKVLFSEVAKSVGLEVTQSGNPDVFTLTFVKHPIDAAIVAGAHVPGDPSVGWDVVFGPFTLDRTTEVVAGGFSAYDLSAAAGGGGSTLTVLDGATTRLTGTVTLGKLYVRQNGMFGGMDGTLDNLTVDAGGSAAFADFAGETSLQWGFGYSGLGLHMYLTSPPAQPGYAATSGYIQTPEPATVGLMGLGLLAALVKRRRT